MLADPQKLSGVTMTLENGLSDFANESMLTNPWLSKARSRVLQLTETLAELSSQRSMAQTPKEKLLLDRRLLEVEELFKQMGADLAMNQALTHPRGQKLLAIWNDAYSLSLKDAKVKTLAILGGNQSGKSFTASKIFSKLVSSLPDGDHVIWCISPNKEKSIGTQQRYVWQDFPRGMVGEYVWTEKNGFGSVNPMVIANMNGKKVVVKFKSVSQYYDDPDAFESETLSGMWIDEAVPHEVWEALQTRVAVRNGFILMSTIPSAEWMWETIENAKDETGVQMHKLLPKDNPAMSDLALERMYASITDPMERAMRLEGKFAMLDGIVFPEFKTDKHVFSDIPKVKMSFYAGMDVGLDHPTTWICVGAGEDGRFYVMDEWSSRHQTPQEDALQLSHFLKKYNLAATTFIDPAAFALSKGQASCVAMQYIQAGIPVAPAGKFSEWNRIMRMKEMFRNDELLVHESCVNLIRELRVWKFKRNQRNQPLNGGAMEDKNNDFLDSLKYCLSMSPVYIGDGRKQLEGFQI